MSDSAIIGWDIGGAHLKAVLLSKKGEVLQTSQTTCELWKGLNKLEAAIQTVLQAFKISPFAAQHAVTMTGELVDLFTNRHEGVVDIASLATNLLGERTLFYAVNTGFVPLQRVSGLWPNIASANWHASASALAMHIQDVLLVDIGSTTTDIIAIEAGKVICSGFTDADRMQADSLVYTGVVRTPLMALAQKLTFANDDGEVVETNVAAEYFATMADVYRLTGELDANADMADTADGKGKTQVESARRLARMIGHDVDNSLGLGYESISKWIQLAFVCKSLQMQQIKVAMLKQLKPNMQIIGAGAGSFLVKAIADDLGRDFMHVYQAVSMRVAEHANIKAQHDIAVCFPAYAVAQLLANQLLISQLEVKQ